jgi:hypothetical protein
MFEPDAICFDALDSGFAYVAGYHVCAALQQCAARIEPTGPMPITPIFIRLFNDLFI